MTTPSAAFPSGDFDSWAESYDDDVVASNVFPFAGYEQALETVVELAAPRAGMSVLDLGTGTGNLAVRFAARGCELWCTDFSQAMLAKARQKVPTARLIRHDLSGRWPPELERRFDRIVSAYVFHHFELERKLLLCAEVVRRRLASSGKLIIADISFPDLMAMKRFAPTVGELWEEEPYWLADDSIQGLQDAGLGVGYVQVSDCAGVYCLESHDNLRAQNRTSQARRRLSGNGTLSSAGGRGP